MFVRAWPFSNEQGSTKTTTTTFIRKKLRNRGSSFPFVSRDLTVPVSIVGKTITAPCDTGSKSSKDGDKKIPVQEEAKSSSSSTTNSEALATSAKRVASSRRKDNDNNEDEQAAIYAAATDCTPILGTCDAFASF